MRLKATDPRYRPSQELNARQQKYLRLLNERGSWTNLSPYFDDREYSTMRSLQLRGRVSMEYSAELGGWIVKPLAEIPPIYLHPVARMKRP